MSNHFTEKPIYVFGMQELKGDYTVQFMQDGEVIEENSTIYPSIKEARRASANKLKASKVEGVYVRIVKVGDASMVDFITKDRMKTRNYEGFDKDDPNYRAKLKELKNARNIRKRRNYPRPED